MPCLLEHMLLKKAFIFSGVVFLFIGLIVFAEVFQSMTGSTIGSSNRGSFNGLWALWFIIGGIALLIESRIVPVDTLEIFISFNALKRSSRDKFVKRRLSEYLKEVNKIAIDPRRRQQEMLGEFHVSPQGHKDIRVAWHFNSQNRTLFVDDFLYHAVGNHYIDNWDSKASQGKITKVDYENSGYKLLKKVG